MVNVEPIFGPMLIGVFINTILYGILIVQVIIYYQSDKHLNDAMWIRYLILYLFICETINTLCDIGLMYEPLVARFGTERAVTRLPILFATDPLLTVLISTPVQLFICWRIEKLFKHVDARLPYIPYFIAFLSLCSFAGGIAVTVFNSHIPKYTDLVKARWDVIVWLVSSAVVDVSITICLVFSLRECRPLLKSTNDAINRHIRLAIHTGAVTSMFAILDYVVFQTVPQTTANFAFDFALGKLYSNSLLSTFNARASDNVGGKPSYNVLFGPQDEQSFVSLSFAQTPNGDLERQMSMNDSRLEHSI